MLLAKLLNTIYALHVVRETDQFHYQDYAASSLIRQVIKSNVAVNGLVLSNLQYSDHVSPNQSYRPTVFPGLVSSRIPVPLFGPMAAVSSYVHGSFHFPH